jgi:predicted nucleic acid-binding protein
MNSLLVDTSVIIDFLRQKDKSNTWFYQLASVNLCVSIMTHAELYAGKSVWERTEAREELEELFSGMKILSVEEAISLKAGQLKATYGVSLLDGLIAATALEYDLALATLNKKDFEMILGLVLYN